LWGGIVRLGAIRRIRRWRRLWGSVASFLELLLNELGSSVNRERGELVVSNFGLAEVEDVCRHGTLLVSPAIHVYNSLHAFINGPATHECLLITTITVVVRFGRESRSREDLAHPRNILRIDIVKNEQQHIGGAAAVLDPVVLPGMAVRTWATMTVVVCWVRVEPVSAVPRRTGPIPWPTRVVMLAISCMTSVPGTVGPEISAWLAGIKLAAAFAPTGTIAVPVLLLLVA
jgi:hypothetical protein